MCKQTNALIPAHDKFTQNLTFSKFYFDIAEIYRRRWLEESGQRLENLDRTRLVMASATKANITKKFTQNLSL